MTPEGEGASNLVHGQFLNFTGKKATASQLAQVHQAEAANKKSDLNQNGILWRYLDKKLTKFMKLGHAQDLQEASYTTSLDQLTEFSIYDALKAEEKEEVTYKKERKVFAGRPITMRVMMRNPLATEILISKVQLVCKYKDEQTSDQDFVYDINEYKIAGRNTIEVILQVTPKRAGQVVIEKVQWELLEQFRCEMPFQAQAGSKISKQLLLKDKIFQLRVLPESVEV